jgi:8-oxo-dGTP pyrophosphatase MutT (NUDIX family)
MGHIRSAARALIIRDGRLLLTQCRKDGEDFYTAPGGGQAEGESLPETLVRECREEIGAEIEVLALRFVRDYIPGNTFSYLEDASHQVEHFFECTVPPDYRAGNGPNPDSSQVGVIWADARALEEFRVFPARLYDLVDPERARDLPVYWGDGH